MVIPQVGYANLGDSFLAADISPFDRCNKQGTGSEPEMDWRW
jgi:hypothetical protein